MSAGDRFDRITERIEEMLEREERLEIFLDASPWGILVVDKTFHIAFINKTLERMTGYQAAELMGEHLHMIMPKDDVSVHIKHEKDFIKNPRVRTGNHGLKPRILRKDKGLISVEISISPTKVHGQQYFFASIRPLETLFNTVEGHERGA